MLLACSGAVIALTSVSVAILARRAPAAPPIVPQLIAVPVPSTATAAPDPEPARHVASGTTDLARFVESWLSDQDAPWPKVEYRRGIVYVESAEDRGDDGPYPRSADPEAQRVCGSASVWLREYLRTQLVWRDDLSCTEDRCTYPGMEYAPTGAITFRRTADGWALDAWTQTYEGALAPDDAQTNDEFVQTALAELARTSCPGEPAGAY